MVITMKKQLNNSSKMKCEKGSVDITIRDTERVVLMSRHDRHKHSSQCIKENIFLTVGHIILNDRYARETFKLTATILDLGNTVFDLVANLIITKFCAKKTLQFTRSLE